MLGLKGKSMGLVFVFVFFLKQFYIVEILPKMQSFFFYEACLSQ